MAAAETRREPMNFRDVKDTLLRRRWVVGGALFFAWALAWTASWLLPAVYCSESKIGVEQQQVPEEYVVANVSYDLQQRLESLRQQILSRTRLERIIDQFQLYKDDHSGNADEVIERMRKDVKLEVTEVPGRRGQISAFKISYNAPTARLAQQVNAQLTSLFIDQNIEEESQRTESTTEFLSTELETARQALAEQEAKVKQFKAGNLGALPSQMDSNVRILSGLQERQHTLSQSLNRAEEQKLYLESLLSQYQTVKTQGDRGGNSLPGYDEQLTKLRRELADDQTKYTPNHPDVLRLKRLIERTEKQRDEVRANMAAGRSAKESAESLHDLQSAAPLLQLQGQLKANEQEIQDCKRELRQVDAQIGDYQARLNGTPIREQQLSDLTRDYDQSKSNYDSLLKKQQQSQLATNLQKRQQGEQFRIIDPPNLPAKPVSPNRLRLSLLGMLAGLIAGIAIAFLLETVDDRLRNEDEIRKLVTARILAGIPHLTTPGEQRKQKIWRGLEWCCAGVLTTIMAAANAYLILRS